MDITQLRYVGQDAFRPGLPARDIDAAELAFLAHQRKVDAGEIVDEAIGSGLYVAVLEDGSTVSARKAETAEQSRADVLRAMTKAELKETAESLGLEVAPRATNPQLVEAIEAEEARLAEEAAATAAAASSSGEGDQGGSTPGEDPDAVASGESGTPPASDQD